MNESGINAVLLKAATAAGLLAGAWLLTVKPANASLQDRSDLVEAQSNAIADYAARTAMRDTTALALENITAHAEQLADRLTRHPTDAGIFAAIESTAYAHGVSVHRIEPRAVPRRSRQSKPTNKPDPVGVTVAEFSIDLSGGYGAVAVFLDTVGGSVGLARVTDLRLAASAGGQVRGVIGLSVYRVPPNTTIIPESLEDGEDEA